MITVRIRIQVTNDPLKLTPVVCHMDTVGPETKPVHTNRTGVALFELPPGTGKILV
jgi:tRNA 2-thiouridine synthesizing protein E